MRTFSWSYFCNLLLNTEEDCFVVRIHMSSIGEKMASIGGV